MLYRTSHERSFSADIFRDPPAEYRGAPFWAWNNAVSEEDCVRITDALRDMGMGGAHLHCRSGMALPYMSSEYLSRIRFASSLLREKGMRTFLYDEDRWPSGAAGGKVTRDHSLRSRFLLFSPEPLLDKEENCASYDSSARAVVSNERTLLAVYRIRLKDGFLGEYGRTDTDTSDQDTCASGAPAFPARQEGSFPSGSSDSGEHFWYLYRVVCGDNPWYNDQAYVDTLNPAAIKRFIEETHEKYFASLGDEFGDQVPSIFTDEPQFSHKETLGFGEEKKPVTLPYTDDFPETYRQTYGEDFFDTFPECIWDLPDGKLSQARYRYHDHICRRFTEAFADQIGNWCREHGLNLTGHMMEEPTLRSQTAALGEAMRSYRSFDIPGIDMLCDWRELTTAKQCESAVHQYGREGMMSEIYGVTNWDFDFRGHKLAGDWQAALGVTLRVHHLTWTSMAGEAKRDYPASIGPQSPWYREYTQIEDHFARLNSMLTRGSAKVRLGVIHPVESYWLYWGPSEQTAEIREAMDNHFRLLTEWLLYGLMDFDFISESLWPELTPDSALSGDGPMKIGKMQYDCILVPGCVTLRSSTLKRLEAFRRAGGTVIFAGEIPTHVDAVRNASAAEFASLCEHVEFRRDRILSALEPFRRIDIRTADGRRTDNIISQIRTEKGRSCLFLAHTRRMTNPDIPGREDLTIRIRDKVIPILCDTMKGTFREAAFRHKKNSTVITASVYDHDSLLYILLPSSETAGAFLREIGAVCSSDETRSDRKDSGNPEKAENITVPCTPEVVRCEPNVLVLDRCSAQLDRKYDLPEDEILRTDNRCREILGLPLRTEAFAQPWVHAGETPEIHDLRLRFRFESEIEAKECFLGLEESAATRVFLNGTEVTGPLSGYYVDPAIARLPLPALCKGENILELQIRYHNRCNVECVYLLGEFGVRLQGQSAVITEEPGARAFGDASPQGLPFYGGDLLYRFPVKTDRDGTLSLSITRYRCPLIGVYLDGRKAGSIAFSPYECTIPGVTAGEHTVELRAYGNRVNTFGTLHNCNEVESWMGPNAWRTTGPAFSYEYQIRRTGILKSPVITLI